MADRLSSFCPGSEAELPRAAEEAVGVQHGATTEDTTPSVLNKLQKWADYDAVGSPVWPTNFIPMKTPFSTEILEHWSLAEQPKHALTVPLLLAGQQAQGREVGLIIDLANHDCLYSDDMPDSLEYEHVQLIAKVLPSRQAIDEVERIAKSFWNEHPDKYIAIHCAYGFNRTGFVVCSYLCQACGLTVEQALESFARARPPGVKHDKFLKELHLRYGSGTASCPPSQPASRPASRPPSHAPTPEGSVRGGSALAETPPAAAVAAAAAAAPADSTSSTTTTAAAAAVAAPAKEQPVQQPHASAAAAAAGPAAASAPCSGQGQQAGQHEEEELPDGGHFEDAAAAVRRGSVKQRSMSLSRGSSSGGGHALDAAAAAAAGAAAVAGGSPVTASPCATPSQHGSSCDISRGGSSLANAAGGAGNGDGDSCPSSSSAAAAAAAAASTEDEAIAAAAAGFAASRKLMQRKSSRGRLSMALAAAAAVAAAPDGAGPGTSSARAGSASPHPAGGSPGGSSTAGGGGASSEQLSLLGGSPVSATPSGIRTNTSSMSDFAAAANHLEGANSMRRATSLGLAKALCEDFSQNNGTPSADAPIAAVGSWDEHPVAAMTQAAVAAAAQQSQQRFEQLTASQQQQQQQRRWQSEGLAAYQQRPQQAWVDGEQAAQPGGGCDGGGADSSTDGTAFVAACGSGSAGHACQHSSAHAGPRAQHSGTGAAQGGSPTKRGGIPPPPGSRAQPTPSRAPSAGIPQQQHHLFLHHHQQQQQGPGPGTPLSPCGGATPVHAAGLQKNSVAGGFLRSVSIDSDNPSLGFGTREALQHLRTHAATGGPGSSAGGADGMPPRGPQALADLFREDSRAELAALDVEEHLKAVATRSASGLDSPAATVKPRALEAMVAAAAAAGAVGGTGTLLQDKGGGASQLQDGRELPDGKARACCAATKAAPHMAAQEVHHQQQQQHDQQQQQQQRQPPHLPAMPAGAVAAAAAPGAPLPTAGGPSRGGGRPRGAGGQGRCRLM